MKTLGSFSTCELQNTYSEIVSRMLYTADFLDREINKYDMKEFMQKKHNLFAISACSLFMMSIVK